MGHSQTLRHKNLLFVALGDLIRRRMRSVVLTLCLATILFPLITALAISEGLRFQAETGVNEGADIYLSDDLFGGEGPISLTYLKELQKIPGVNRATVRVVGRTYFVDRLVAVIGLEKKTLSSLKPLIQGAIPAVRGEVIVGRSIAKEFVLQPGMPFTVAANKRKVFKVTGILSPSCLWGSNVMIMHYEDANEFFILKDRATQLLFYTSSKNPPQIAGTVAYLKRIGREQSICFHISERNHIQKKVRSGYGHTEGIFTVLFIIGAALAIPAFLVISGFGLREVDKEIGVLKAIGWKTRDILEKVVLENLLVSLTAISLSILISMVCIKGLNGIFIAQFYIAEVGLIPDVDIPSRYLPFHALFCLIFALGVTFTGGVFSTWKKARKPPQELMR